MLPLAHFFCKLFFIVLIQPERSCPMSVNHIAKSKQKSAAAEALASCQGLIKTRTLLRKTRAFTVTCLGIMCPAPTPMGCRADPEPFFGTDYRGTQIHRAA